MADLNARKPAGKWLTQRIPVEHRQIAQSALLVAVFVLLAKIIAAAKEMFVAWQYGVGDIVDAYQIANTVMLWLPTTLGTALTTLLIPTLLSSKPDYADRRHFAAEFQGWSVLVGLVLATATYLLLPLLAEWLPTHALTAVRLQYVREFCGSFFVPAVVSLPIVLYSALLMAHRRQWNTLLEGMPALCILLAIWLLHSGRTDTTPMYWGTVLGYILQTACLYHLLRRDDAAPAGVRFTLHSAQWKDIRDLLGLLLLSQFFLSWATPIDLTTAVTLGEGAVAQLSYAERLLSLVLGIGSVAISRAVLPVFSEMAATNQWSKLLDYSLKWGGIMFILGLLFSLAAWPLAPWGVRMLYERGAFNSSDTAAVAHVFTLGLTRVPFYFAGVVFFQLLASQRRFGWAAGITMACILIKYPLNTLLAKYFGVGGINLATGAMYCMSAVLQLGCGYYAMRRLLT